MKTIEVRLGKDLATLLKRVSKASGISLQASAEWAFAKGLVLSMEVKQSLEERMSHREGLEAELVMVRKRVNELRSQLSTVETAYAVTNFNAFEAFNNVGGMLMLYNVFRADLLSLCKEARSRGLKVEIDPSSTEVPRIEELLNRYLFRREKAIPDKPKSQGGAF